ncbi:DUF222 domain-containing protein [Gordonia amicalis]|uniref:DUF222 domain-containing protein n=1 Tax=Gordonia amicalis TaxID=89053 RepID=A0AAE4R5V6_9ACTN|nr:MULTISPECIES: DUF222 domain-containing protein [Gordonia]MCZ4580344.1 DUF222 domain-containing protein [Gordonia amicalis]MCZ4653453.1 DUF222 domain-containing protein [Gordonia amicalis]MDV6312547.1 DUF222 domain-containing protein [Gordonia amicalis]NKX78692.1 DUF222 domain-containing protein [Gordonia amicalis]UPW12690.1 DUF222 domain-containing protein [Gordonia amicalis]
MSNRWTDLPGEFFAGVDPAHPESSDTATHMERIRSVRHGEAYLAWCRYQSIAIVYDQLVVNGTGGFFIDRYTEMVTRVCREDAITRYQADRWVGEALALRERLPKVLTTLRDGILSRQLIQTVVSRTDLISDDTIMADLDTEIERILRSRTGAWTTVRLRDMVDRLVFRHDPDAVRERRREALDKRGMWTENFADGTGEITGVMAAENVRIAEKAVKALADTVCAHDGRTRNQRNSDAMFALLTGTAFECQCQREDCDADIPDPAEVVRSVSTEIVIHAVTDPATLDGAPGIAWVDGHGVISDEHIRDLAARPDAIIKPITPVRTAPIRVAAESDSSAGEDEGDAQSRQAERSRPDAGATGESTESNSADSPEAASSGVVVVYPGAQSADPYRPTTACADFVRVRDGYCTEPGCAGSSFDSDLDHVTEYDHTNPTQGGDTSSENLNAKCRFGHLHKTFGDWIDVQYRDDDGHLVTEYRTPDGVVIPGDAETLEDFFPNLRRIRYEQPPQAPPTPRVITGDDAPPPTNRLANKHARRRAERARNKKQRLTDQADPPPF